MLLGSAVVGAGVQEHICYLPFSGDSANGCPSSASLTLGELPASAGRQLKQSEEEAQLEKERKMLALADVLRRHIPSKTQGSRPVYPSGRKERELNACVGSLEASSAAFSFSSASESAAAVQPTKAEGCTKEMSPQCIVFANSQEEVKSVAMRIVNLQHYPSLK